MSGHYRYPGHLSHPALIGLRNKCRRRRNSRKRRKYPPGAAGLQYGQRSRGRNRRKLERYVCSGPFGQRCRAGGGGSRIGTGCLHCRRCSDSRYDRDKKYLKRQPDKVNRPEHAGNHYAGSRKTGNFSGKYSSSRPYRHCIAVINPDL